MTDETSNDVEPPDSSPGPAPTTSPAPSVSFFLIALGRRAQQSVEAGLREHGLAYHHLSALGHLHRQPGLSYSELARRAHVTVQSMQSTTGLLERQGLVERGASTTQGRRADLHVTDRGRQVLGAAEAAIRIADQELLADVPATERSVLESALLRMFVATSRGLDPNQPTG